MAKRTKKSDNLEFDIPSGDFTIGVVADYSSSAVDIIDKVFNSLKERAIDTIFVKRVPNKDQFALAAKMMIDMVEIDAIIVLCVDVTNSYELLIRDNLCKVSLSTDTPIIVSKNSDDSADRVVGEAIFMAHQADEYLDMELDEVTNFDLINFEEEEDEDNLFSRRRLN